MENSFAVITGASSGTGMEIARQLGSHGHDLLIASGSDDIFEAQEELEGFGYNVDAVKANLGTYAGVENLYDQIKAIDRPVDVFVINASMGPQGLFTETEIKDEISFINLNIVSLIHITKLILKDMKINDHGKILFNTNVLPYANHAQEAVTEASRAFIETFCESLRDELKETNITITLLSSGIGRTRGKAFSETLLNKLQVMARKVLTIKNRESSRDEKSEPDRSSYHH